MKIYIIYEPKFGDFGDKEIVKALTSKKQAEYETKRSLGRLRFMETQLDNIESCDD